MARSYSQYQHIIHICFKHFVQSRINTANGLPTSMKGEQHFDHRCFSVQLAEETMRPGSLAILSVKNLDCVSVNRTVLVVSLKNRDTQRAHNQCGNRAHKFFFLQHATAKPSNRVQKQQPIYASYALLRTY